MTDLNAEALAAASRSLVEKLEAIHADDNYQSVWTVSMLHIGPYKGPTYTEELAALKEALSSPTAGRGVEAWLGEADGFKSFTRQKSVADKWLKSGMMVTAVWHNAALQGVPDPALPAGEGEVKPARSHIVEAAFAVWRENRETGPAATALFEYIEQLEAAIRSPLLPISETRYTCPICTVPFKPSDLCASDIELGTCHATCLEGSPVVDLDTGEPSDGPIATYLYASPAPSQGMGWSVRKLEWAHVPRGKYVGLAFRAESIFGEYTAHKGCAYFDGALIGQGGTTIADGQAIAQAHYDAAIRSAIESAEGWRTQADEKLAEIRHQLQINVNIIKSDLPDTGSKIGLPHLIEVLSAHVEDRLKELEAILPASPAEAPHGR